MGRSFKDEELTKIIKLKDDGFKNTIKERFTKLKNDRIKSITESVNKNLEKRIFLQTVDFLWRSHLQYLEHLRQVVGLRSYGQKDPLEEFKKESFVMFEGLLNKIKTDFITFLNNLEVVSQEKVRENENTKPLEKSLKIPKKMRRNEPCFCGSGKKYKHCHGSL